jgi:hypothetical protein
MAMTTTARKTAAVGTVSSLRRQDGVVAGSRLALMSVVMIGCSGRAGCPAMLVPRVISRPGPRARR